jgi:MFS family permease
MSIDIGAVFEDGLHEWVTRKGAILVGLFVVVGVLGSVASDSLGLAIIDALVDFARDQGEPLPPESQEQLDATRENLGWALEVGVGAALALLVASFLVGEFVRIGAVRALADRSTDAFERQHYAENALSIFLHRIAAAIVTFVLLAVAFLITVFVPGLLFGPLAFLGLVPFLYVAIGLYFASFAVTIDEKSALDGIQYGWQLADGNRLNLVAITIGVVVVSFVISIPTFFFLDFGTGGGLEVSIRRTPLALVGSALVGGVQSVFRLAIGAQAYTHLVEDHERDDEFKVPDDELGDDTQF